MITLIWMIAAIIALWQVDLVLALWGILIIIIKSGYVSFKRMVYGDD